MTMKEFKRYLQQAIEHKTIQIAHCTKCEHCSKRCVQYVKLTSKLEELEDIQKVVNS